MSSLSPHGESQQRCWDNFAFPEFERRQALVLRARSDSDADAVRLPDEISMWEGSKRVLHWKP